MNITVVLVQTLLQHPILNLNNIRVVGSMYNKNLPTKYLCTLKVFLAHVS